ncbi:winged helix DNA-binding domain-containing protein [Microbacterium sp. NPDC089696]|uniref:winged helix DNA-binding domain-containing protein n=1 Tax=Microbacterium sp. NPDC089696 TaxID=3364199 RepID=UPI0037F999D5
MVTLGTEDLNRALLARQMLDERVDVSALSAIDRLVGLQAQEPRSPYIGLWSRLVGFRPEELESLLTDRAAVRILLMRGTIHLTTTADALGLRPHVQPKLDREMRSGPFAKPLREAQVDTDELAVAGRAVLAAEPRSTADVGAVLRERWPDASHTVLGNAIRLSLPLVQVPPRGLWRSSGRAVCATLEQWLGREQQAVALEDVVVRYLRAFGPATVMDAQQWSGLTRLGGVFESLRDRLVTFRDEAGKELFDLPDAPRPGPDTDVPVRLLPEFDNILLAHADRRRVIADDRLGLVIGGKRTVLVDGQVAATWSLDADQSVSVDYIDEVTRRQRDAVSAECERLTEWLRNT